MVLINNRLFFSCVLGGGGGTTVTSMLTVHFLPSQQLHYQFGWYGNEFSYLLKIRISLSHGEL